MKYDAFKKAIWVTGKQQDQAGRGFCLKINQAFAWIGYITKAAL